MFLHGGGTFSWFRSAMGAKVWEDDAITRREGGRCGEPQFMAGGKGVKQDDWRAVALYFVEDLSVVAIDDGHKGDLNTKS
jgi:hypothetical protein